MASAAQIETGLKILARLIAAYGDAYWPLFERLEKEFEHEKTRQNRLERYLPTTIEAEIKNEKTEEN